MDSVYLATSPSHITLVLLLGLPHCPVSDHFQQAIKNWQVGKPGNDAATPVHVICGSFLCFASGMFCGAQFQEDGKWYRAKVKGEVTSYDVTSLWLHQRLSVV